jgi:4-amino-4-deoxy-L-arabinose transferase-like glycosyltransferase
MSHSRQTPSAGSLSASAAPLAVPGGADWASRARASALAGRAGLLVLVALAGALNLWALGRNGWANDYYSAAVRSMSASWHDFLFASLDPSGVMTVDKPPLALWVQALSVRLFGYHSLSVLVPQALMGIASVVLVYDLVRRRFNRLGGLLAGLALALTPMTVAVSRHNNPDALLVLCCVAAVWFSVRALEDGRTRWLMLAGVAAGLGFETKMAVALTVVPGVAVAWLWICPAGRTRLHALRQLLAGGAALVLVGGAWPALVQLTPASRRPWISGTSDNSIFSLIFGYNGLGRVDGQTGGPGGAPGGGANSLFGGSAGPLRLVNAALGGQAGWLLGFALGGALAILLSSRLRRSDARSGWLLIVGGAFVTTAVLFSAASGIFHPYYVALLAPFTAALVGAGAAELLGGGRAARVLAPLAVLAGVIVELVLRADYPGQLSWLAPLLVATGALGTIALSVSSSSRTRRIALGAALAALLAAPAAWALDTLGHAASATFPAGGPASVESAGGPGRGLAGRAGGLPGGPFAGRARLLFGEGGASPRVPGRAAAPAGGASVAPGIAPRAGAFGGSARPPGGFGGGGIAGPGPFGGEDASLESDLSYVAGHGGGTIAVASQSSAAAAIISQNASVAGIGGFSGRESSVTTTWLAQEVKSGRIRWLRGETGGSVSAFMARLPGDTRMGSRRALEAVERVCREVSVPGAGSGFASGLYDCQGRAAQLAAVGARG